MEQKSKFDEFLFALIYLADERSKENPHVETIRNWYQRTQELFEAAVSEAVRQEIENVDLKIVVKTKQQSTKPKKQWSEPQHGADSNA